LSDPYLIPGCPSQQPGTLDPDELELDRKIDDIAIVEASFSAQREPPVKLMGESPHGVHNP
jgi:hypothetical protein